MKKKVFLFRIEIKGLPGSELPKNAIGAAVNCVVPGENKDDAEGRLKEALSEDKYKLISVDKIEDFDSLKFDASDKEYLDLRDDALKHDEVYYGEFNIW